MTPDEWERRMLDLIAHHEGARDAAGAELLAARRDLAATRRMIVRLDRRLACYRLTWRDLEARRAADAMRAMWGG